MKDHFTLLFFFVRSALFLVKQKQHKRWTTSMKDSRLYFYRNTLRMLNQTEDKSFDELIKDIEKMRFLMIDKTKSKFDQADYKKLLTGYKVKNMKR